VPFGQPQPVEVGVASHLSLVVVVEEVMPVLEAPVVLVVLVVPVVQVVLVVPVVGVNPLPAPPLV